MTRWHFLGHPLQSGFPERWPSGIPVRELEPDGGYVYRVRPGPVPRCKCGGLKGQHGTDRRGRPTCFCSSVCACTEMRPEDVQAAMDRHPAGKANPTDNPTGETP